jgi:ABC-type dipeptide/oligopeptide/nickel transport system permease component
MVLLGTLIAIVLGIASGVWSAWRRGGVGDTANTTFAIVLYALPVQWLGLVLLGLFAGALPAGGMSDPFLVNPSLWEQIADYARHVALPALTFAVTLYGQYSLIVRSSMLETLGEDYVLTARAKGLRPWLVLRRHALRNAMLPTSTLIALSIGYIVAGSILIETVFSWPGIGRAVYESVLQRDYPMLQGAFLVLAVSVIVANLIVDLLYVRLDPRVKA